MGSPLPAAVANQRFLFHHVGAHGVTRPTCPKIAKNCHIHLKIMHDSKSMQLGRVEAIDALRGLAALAVVFLHARQILWVGMDKLFARYHFQPNLEAWAGYATFPLKLGWLGVTLFFVLSGYCIHRRGAQRLAANPQARLDLFDFARRRFWRIYPTYAVALLLTGVIDWLVFRHTGGTSGNCDHRWSTLLASLVGLQGLVSPMYGSNGVFWTLAMEIHLYLAYPVLFWISRRYNPKRVLLMTFIISSTFAVADVILRIQNAFPYHFVRGPIFLPYWFTWAVGFYLAEAEARRAVLPSPKTLAWLAVGGFLGGMTLVVLNHPEASEIFWAVLFGVAVWWSLGERGRRVWDTIPGRLASFVGVFSYSLYAVHFPLLQWFAADTLPDGSKPYSLLLCVLGGGFVVFAAWVFFQCVERWSLRRPKCVASNANK